jgi:hypothetical protein
MRPPKNGEAPQPWPGDGASAENTGHPKHIGLVDPTDWRRIQVLGALVLSGPARAVFRELGVSVYIFDCDDDRAIAAWALDERANMATIARLLRRRKPGERSYSESMKEYVDWPDDLCDGWHVRDVVRHAAHFAGAWLPSYLRHAGNRLEKGERLDAVLPDLLPLLRCAGVKLDGGAAA